MPKIIVYGASDDLVEIDNVDPESEEYREEYPALRGAQFELKAPDGERMGIWAKYSPEGVWVVAPYVLDEEDSFPNWSFSIGQGNEGQYPGNYSMYVEVEIPDGTTITRLNERPDD